MSKYKLLSALAVLCTVGVWGFSIGAEYGESRYQKTIHPWPDRIWNISYNAAPREGDIWIGWDEPRDSAVTNVRVFQNGDWELVWERDKATAHE